MGTFKGGFDGMVGLVAIGFLSLGAEAEINKLYCGRYLDSMDSGFRVTHSRTVFHCFNFHRVNFI